jgi:L-ribulose-5-phosphate 4-epimerase
MAIPALGTTHADYFYGDVPCTAPLSDGAIGGKYVHETGMAIVRRFAAGADHAAVDPMAVPACLVAGHAPFAWGKDVHDAAHNAVVLEAVARMAYRTLTLKAEADVVTQALLDRHYFRKHGAGKTYGQA